MHNPQYPGEGRPYNTSRVYEAPTLAGQVRYAPDGEEVGPELAAKIRRGGLTGWWLDLTAPPRPPLSASIAQRELNRKAELTSLSILAVFIFLVMLVSNSLADASTGQAVATTAIVLLIAAVLNRTGRTRVAAYLVPSLLLLLLMAAILQASGGLRLVWLPAYDLFVIPIIISSLIAGRNAPWLFGIIAIAFLVGDFALQPHAAFGEIDREIKVFTWWGMINRHVALAFFAAFFGWLGARSVEQALQRADRAEELAAMEHVLAEQKRQLDIGIRQVLETHVRVANGDFSARAPLTQDNVLFQIAASLNNLLNRLGRAAQAEHYYQRTVAEIQRLRDSLLAARAGRPALWPAPSGTPVDALIEVIAGPVARPGPSVPFPQVGSPSGPRAGNEFQPSAIPFQAATPTAPDWRPASTGEWEAQPPSGGHDVRPGGGWDMAPLPDRFPPQDPNARG